jgi:hypothetical protein
MRGYKPRVALRSRLDLFQLISASLNRDVIAPADGAFQFSDLCRKSVHFGFSSLD